MTGADLSTTNLLLGIMAGVQLIFLIGVVVAGLYARSAFNKLNTTVSQLEREHVQPLRARVERILDDATRISARVEGQAARIDANMTTSLDAAERQARRVAHAVSKVARETSAVATGVKAAVTAVGAGLRAESTPAPAYPPPAPIRPTTLHDDPLASATAFESEYDLPKGDHHHESVR